MDLQQNSGDKLSEILDRETQDKLKPREEQEFDFSVLWEDEEEESLLRFVPVANLVLTFILMIIILAK